MNHHFESKPQRAIRAYIAKAKALPIFDPHVPEAIDWTEPSWNVTPFVKRARESSMAFVPLHHAVKRTPTSSDLMAQPLGDLVKAFLASDIDENSRKQGRRRKTNVFKENARFLRALDEVLRARGEAGRADRLTQDDLTAAVDRISKSVSGAAAMVIRRFARELDACGIASDLKTWHHPALRKPSNSSSRVNVRKRRNNLTEAEVSCLARAYRGTETDKDRIAMSIVALLLCAPSRREEAFLLPAHAEIVENPGDGLEDGDTPFHLRRTYKCGLRWWSVKNGPAQVKFVPREMMPVAVEALDTIREITREARDVAAWMIENPGKIRLPASLEHVRAKGFITREEMNELIPGAPSWLSKKGIKAAVLRRTASGYGMPGLYPWPDVERSMLADLPQGWPVLSTVSQVDYSDALCISLVAQFEERRATRSWMVEPVSTKILDEVLSGVAEQTHQDGRVQEAIPSIFERLDIRLPDGTFPKITSHQIRHYLNTIAQRARVPQAHIAYWSGRKHVMQNADYDHTDMLFEVEQIKRGGTTEDLPAIPVVDDSDVDNLVYLSGDRKMQLHSTAYGYCHRRFMEDPCDRAGACRTCTRLVCLGGSKRAADLLAREAARDERSLQNLRARQAGGRTVNSKTVHAVECSVARSRALAEAIMNPANEGKIIRNIEVGPLIDFSHADRVIETKRQEIAAETAAKALP